jgi:hypothetical protein
MVRQREFGPCHVSDDTGFFLVFGVTGNGLR